MTENEQRNPGGNDNGGRREGKPSGVFAFFLTASVLSWEFVRRALPRRAARLRAALPPEPDRPFKKMAPSADKPLQTESDLKAIRRARQGTPWVLLAFLAGMAGGIGFLYLYWTGGGNELLGLTLAICLGGFGCVLVLYAQFMLRHELVAAPREEVVSTKEEREQFAEGYAAAVESVHRRSLLKWMGAGVAAMFAAIFVSMCRSFAAENPAKVLFAPVWKSGDRLMTINGKALTVNSLQQGGMAVVFPEGSIGMERSQTVLVRVNPSLLQLPSGRAHWAPQGYLAYSRVCTHAGCAVGMYEAHSELLLCPCHQSTFDVLRGAVPTGGPAARALPQLPLYVDSDGTLRASGNFSAPPGPGFTGLPL